MLYKLMHPTRIAGEQQDVGFTFEVPEGHLPPGSHVQGQNGETVFRAYAEVCNEHEIEQHQAHQARLKADAEAAAAAEVEAELADPAPVAVRAGKWVRLIADAQIDGALREAGYKFFLPSGEQGPMRSVRKGHDRVDVAKDNTRIEGIVVDEPLYEDATDA